MQAEAQLGTRCWRVARLAAHSTVLLSVAGCMSLQPQLPPTDFAELERISEREAREAAYAEHTIVEHETSTGIRYTKGTHPNAPKRGWQSLDKVLRSDASSAAAIPVKKARRARFLAAMAGITGIATIAGFSATAREGLDTTRLDGGGALLLGGGLITVGLAISAGIVYGRMRNDYEYAVDLYNDSLGLRLGLYDADGEYLPPGGVAIDEDGFIILDADRPPGALTVPASSRPRPEGPAPAPAR